MYIKIGRPFVERVDVACAYCGAKVTRRVTDMQRLKTGRVFCSSVCRDQVGCKPKTGRYKACQVCEKEFYSQPCFDDQKYCSRKCHDVSQTKPKILRNCETCKKPFQLHRSQVLNGAARFCSKHCEAITRTTRHAGFEYNGRPAVIDHFGYVRVWQPDHPRAGHGRVLYHRIVMEQSLGRRLTKDEQVDHINRIKTDNRIENLQLLSASDHSFKTNGDRIRDVEEAKSVMSELEQYRARYGPLNS